MGRALVSKAKEVQDSIILFYYVGLFTQEKYNNWCILCKLAKPAEIRHPWKTSSWGKLSKSVLLQQYNAEVHVCKVKMDAVEYNWYELIPHPAYLPDLDPTNFFLLPTLKNVDVIPILMNK